MDVVSRIMCCKDCVAPKRHIGCHSTCEEYLKERAEADRVNKIGRKEKDSGRSYKRARTWDRSPVTLRNKSHIK